MTRDSGLHGLTRRPVPMNVRNCSWGVVMRALFYVLGEPMCGVDVYLAKQRTVKITNILA